MQGSVQGGHVLNCLSRATNLQSHQPPRKVDSPCVLNPCDPCKIPNIIMVSKSFKWMIEYHLEDICDDDDLNTNIKLRFLIWSRPKYCQSFSDAKNNPLLPCWCVIWNVKVGILISKDIFHVIKNSECFYNCRKIYLLPLRLGELLNLYARWMGTCHIHVRTFCNKYFCILCNFSQILNFYDSFWSGLTFYYYYLSLHNTEAFNPVSGSLS